jgi:CDK inhibitor PHO81
LKKWDKRSKSNTQEMYLERQVEVQPCFNREFIAKLSDIVAANLLDLENGSDHLSTNLFADLPEMVVDRRVDFDSDAGQALAMDALVDLENGLGKALVSGREAIADWLKVAKGRQQRGKDRRVMRILWRAALSVKEEDLNLVLSSAQLDFDGVDNINGRSPLHQACMAGSIRLVQICVETVPALLERTDAYDRRPLHYAAMHGHADIVSYLLHTAQSSSTDMDGYTPLMHAITQGHLDVVRIFVTGKIPVEPTKVSNDLIPLSLACQYGHLEVACLLLQSGAKVIPNSEGLYPQHFAAKAGHDAICQLLVDAGGPDGGGKDRQDKYNLWTPLHHAAVGGEPRHLACIRVLVKAGCDVNASDEYGKSPGWYAAWFGHVDILNFLLDSGAKLGKQHALEGMESLGLAADPQMDALSPGSDVELDREQGMEEFELRPSLSLPPPIIP